MDKLARKLAKQCRDVVEPVLYGWEVKEVEQEFQELILAAFKELLDDVNTKSSGREIGRIEKPNLPTLS